MVNLSNTRELNRLRASITASNQAKQVFADCRREDVRQFVGDRYGQSGAPDKVPVNYLELAVSTLLHRLSARNPQVLVTTPHRAFRPRARMLELTTNRQLKLTRYKDELRRAVLDSLFAIGCMKQHLAPDDDAGKPRATQIDFDDLILDMSASRVDQMGFIGNYYTMNIDEARENPLFNKNTRSKLRAAPRTGFTAGRDRLADISTGGRFQFDEYRQTVEFMDIVVPDAGAMLTLTAEGYIEEPLRVLELDGDPLEMYRLLLYTPVPGNLMPLPPSLIWQPLHDLANRLFRMMGRQAEREKTNFLAKHEAVDDAERIRAAADGEYILMDDPTAVREIHSGGVSNLTLTAFLQTTDQFNFITGNLESWAGLGPSADTVGQEKIIHAGANARVVDMQQTVLEFIEDTVGEIARMLWGDPITEYELTEQIPGTDVTFPVTWFPIERGGSLTKYDIGIEPYSMQHRTPFERATLIIQFWKEIVIPMAPMMAQVGILPDIHGFLRAYKRLTQVDELEDLLVVTRQLPHEQMDFGGAHEGGRYPNTSHRVYERVNRPGATRSGKAQILTQALMGSRPQASELASTARRIG